MSGELEQLKLQIRVTEEPEDLGPIEYSATLTIYVPQGTTDREDSELLVHVSRRAGEVLRRKRLARGFVDLGDGKGERKVYDWCWS